MLPDVNRSQGAAFRSNVRSSVHLVPASLPSLFNMTSPDAVRNTVTIGLI